MMQQPRRNSGLARPAPSSPQGGGNQPKSQWTSAVRLFDPYFSALDLQVVAELGGTSLGFKLSPVYENQRGPDSQKGVQKYNYEAAALVVLQLTELIQLKEQLANFITGKLTEFVLSRGDTKRIVFARSSAFFARDHEEYEIHKDSLVLSVEQDADEKNGGRVVTFVSRPTSYQLTDDTDVVVFQEMNAILAVVESFIANSARVDFASVRLLGNVGGSSQSTASTAPQPTRMAAASSNQTASSGSARPRGIVTQGRPTASAAASQTGMDPADDPASGQDIDDALGAEGGLSSDDEALLTSAGM